ncbi:sperm-associated antigen 8 isoform X2 [Hemitrygon akajei]|uniref:sperm-associated antigen 8 isoform X2 n=1 Tax=Hemitrygon akajei TaxID=2704970 RepID=UPI003BF98B78
MSSAAVRPRTPGSVRNITGNALTTIEHIYKDCCLKEAASIIKKPHHPEALFSLLPLGRKYRSLNPTPPGSGTVKYAPLNHPDPEPAWMTSLTSTELIPQPMDSLSMTLQLISSRNSAPIDQQQAKTTSRALAFKNGHKGLLSIDYLSRMSGISTYKEFYHPPSGPEEREIGIRKQLFEKCMYHKISKEVYDEYKEPFAIQPMESLSVTGRDFKMEGFKSVPRPPVMRHDYKTEQPITIWSDHVKQVQGVTEIKTGDTPFRKNASFTRPIMEALDT